jgi:hypothetical protein
MTITRIEERQLDPKALEGLTRQGPVIVTNGGTPVYIVHQATPEWLEALALEEDRPGDMSLEEYARLYHITLDTESYIREAPDDTPYTTPPTND